MNLDICGLTFSYNSAPVLDNVDFCAHAGEVLSIIGPNGSGKSTMLKCISGLLRPSGGSVLVDKSPLSEMAPQSRARHMGFVPQAEGRPFPASVFDTILSGRKPHMKWRPSTEDREIAAQVIEDLGLCKIAMRDIHQLSGGQRQKVNIARAIAQRPSVLLLDEPTASLDLKHQIEVLEMIRSLSAGGVTTVVAIHDLNHAASYSDRIVMLKGGRVHAAGGTEVLTPKSIRNVYGVDVEIVAAGTRRIIVPAQEVRT